MGMTITQMPCNPGNYTAKRSSAIRYLVVHYPRGRVHYYDAQKNWLSCSSPLYNVGERSVPVPAVAEYFRLIGYYNDHYDVTLVIDGDAPASLGHDGTGLSTNGTKNMHVGTHVLTLPEDAVYFVVTGYSETGGHYAFTLA